MNAPKRARRRWVRALLLGAATIAVWSGITGCRSNVSPPPLPDDPCTVFLLSEALHTGVVLPPNAPGQQYVEFGFGEWNWYALGNEAWYHAFSAVLWPTDGGLGWRTFGAYDEAQLRAAAHWCELAPLTVSAAKAKVLRERLEALCAAGAADSVRRGDLGFTFVPMDRSYWLFQNCADVAAEWLRELDCSVNWAPVRLGLELD